MTILIILFICLVCKALPNANYWYRSYRYKNLYLKYLEEKASQHKGSARAGKEESSGKIGWKVVEDKASIIELFEKAGLKSFQLTITQPTGYNFVKHRQIDLFQNLCNPISVGDTSIPNAIINYFFEAIGIYKKRLKESFSIFYWTQVIIFFPSTVVAYLGLSALDSKKIRFIARVLNTMYWIGCFVLVITHQHLIVIF